MTKFGIAVVAVFVGIVIGIIIELKTIPEPK